MRASPKGLLIRAIIALVVLAVLPPLASAVVGASALPVPPVPDSRLLQLVDITDTADGTPVLNQANDTYYQLVSIKKFWPKRFLRDAVNWGEASGLAFAMTHNGRRGRLAIVDSEQVHNFLRDHFPIDREAWIGLRYWCNFKRFTWVNGETHKLTGFNNWGSPWNVGGAERFDSPPTVCTPQTQYWSVHYWRMEYGFNWNANGEKKAYPLMFVEYPSPPGGGKPADKVDEKPSS